MKKLSLNLKSGKRTKGFILSLDISIAVFVAFILIIVSVYYVGLANEEPLSRLQMVRTGNDILAILDYKEILDGLDKIEIQNEMKTLLPPGYEMRVIIRGTFPYESGIAENGVGDTIVDVDKNWDDDEWVGYDVVILSGLNNGQQRRITGNTDEQLTVDTDFSNLIEDDSYEIVSKQMISETGDATGGSTITIQDTDMDEDWDPNEWVGYDVVILSGENVGEQRQIQSNTENELTIMGNPFPELIQLGDTYEIVFQRGIVAESSKRRLSKKFIMGGKRTFVIYHEPEEYFATADFWIWLK